MKRDVGHQALQTWNKLNDVLRSADEKTCLNLLEVEMKGRNRIAFLLRIHSRLNKVRADNERVNIIRGKM